MTGFRWFFASFWPALRYITGVDKLPAVVEFKTTRALRFADLRPIKAVAAGTGGVEPNAGEIKQNGLDGIIIAGTSGQHDYEYGFVSGADLDYVSYELAPDDWEIAERGKALFWNQPESRQNLLLENWQRQRNDLRAKIEQELARSE
jgi:hypothetical protein